MSKKKYSKTEELIYSNKNITEALIILLVTSSMLNFSRLFKVGVCVLRIVSVPTGT